MKLFRFGSPGQEKPGLILPDGKKIDASAFGEDYNEQFFASNGLARLQSWADKNAATAPEVADTVRLGPAIARPSKIICVGLNYRDHAEESKMAIPVEPILFYKSTTSICGPNDDLIIPKGSQKTDWEVELAVVIGKKATYIEKEQAMEYVAGYMLHNDYSERAFQLERSGQWLKGKGCDTFAPLGPFLATQDELSDVHNLKMWLKVNGKTMQNGSTTNLIFNIPFVVSYITQFMTLLPGDVISTGTPAGVGLGFNPPIYIKPGDVIELGIEGLGTSRQQAKAYQG